MRIAIMLSLAFLALSGCATSGGGTPPDQNDNVNSNGGGTGLPGQNDNEAAPNDNVSSANDNASDANDNGDDSDDLPVAFRLDGVWDDNGRHAIIEQNGVAVSADYFSEYICDVDSGPVPVGEEPPPGANTESTFIDFRGTLNNGEDVLPGDIITGETSICLVGFSGGGHAFGDMTLSVVDENTLSGEWEYDDDGDGQPELSGSILLTREQ